jgi:hypothetical protein
MRSSEDLLVPFAKQRGSGAWVHPVPKRLEVRERARLLAADGTRRLQDRPTLAEAGIDKNLAHRARKLYRNLEIMLIPQRCHRVAEPARLNEKFAGSSWNSHNDS